VVVIDRAMAVAGWVYASLRRRGARVPLVVMVGLLIASLVPVLIVGSTPEPTAISLADLRDQRLPAGTSWYRFEGELRPVAGASPATGPFVYTLHDTGDDSVAITVVSPAKLDAGHAQVTGRIGSTASVRGTFQTLDVDVPTEPVRHDPWWLFGIPALMALTIAYGRHVGYPVVRRDRRRSAPAIPVRPDESLPARWSGRVGSDLVAADAMQPCTVFVTCDSEVCEVVLTEDAAARTVLTRRASPKQRLRICRTDGSLAALGIHAPTADLVIAFETVADRDRLGATVE
jgi:hypothetical protein